MTGATHGASYIGSNSNDSYESDEGHPYRHGNQRRRLTMIPRSPLAPPPLAAAFLQIWSSAALVNRSSIPEYPNSAVYCERSEPLTSVSTRRRSDGESGVSVVMDGIREINSGMKLLEYMSVTSRAEDIYRRTQI